jgi:PAS domain S-box-containing protein
MELTTGLLAGVLLLLGISLWRLIQQRDSGLLKSRIIAATGCSIVVTDATVPRHPVVYVNAAFRLLTGYADDEILGQSLVLLNGPQTDRGIIERLAMAIQEGRAFRALARHYRKNGTSFWNELTVTPIKNRAGRVTEHVWVMSDATARHEAAEIRKDTKDLSRLPGLLSQGIIVANDSTIVYINPAALMLLGIATPAEAVGKPIQSVFDPDTLEAVRHCIEHHPPHDSGTRVTGRLVQQDGRSVEVNLSTDAIPWDGKTACLLLVSRPSTRAKVAKTVPERPEVPLEPGKQAIAYFGSWDRDIRTGIEIWSDEQCRIFGYEPGTILPTYDMFKAALHPEDRARVLGAVEDSLLSDAPYDVECRIIQPCGTVRFVRSRGVVVRNFTGEPIRMSGTVEDVTSARLIEEVAKERNLEFKLVIESAPSGMLMVREDGTISLVNTKIEQMFGYTKGELLGRPIEMLFPERFRPTYTDDPQSIFPTAARRAMGSGGELYGLRKDGTEVSLEISLNPMHTSSGTTTLVCVVDITGRKETERAILEHQERLDLAVRAANVGIFEHDHKTGSLYWSSTLRAIFGLTDEDAASLQRYVDLIPHEEREQAFKAIREAHQPSGDGRFQVEHRIIRPDGGSRHVRVCSFTSFGGEGTARTPVRTVGAVVDITVYKDAELRWQEASKIEAIGTLTGGIAHEFNNSMTAVLGFSELALPLVPADSKAHHHIRQVITAGRKSRELAHQLLTFSRQTDQVRRPLSLHLLVKESLTLLRPAIPSWIELRECIAGSTRPISADMMQMHQLVLHLVGNALHAMSRTGGVLEIQLQDKELVTDQMSKSGRLSAGSYVCLTVRDSGEGMEPEVASRISDPFFTTTPPGEGRRRGLSVVHAIVTSHGGTVLVESQPGAGATVSAYFPALPPRAAAVPTRDEPLPRGHECILFVDDEESLARLGGEMLESLGYFPVVRGSAAEAWEAFRIVPQRFDLLITDQTMPGMSGELLVRECRRLRPDLPAILCTGSDQTLSETEAPSHGATECVLKPLTLHDLAHTIRRVFDHPDSTLASNPKSLSRHGARSTLLIEESDAVSTRR